MNPGAFLLFSFMKYYPDGGLSDLQGVYPSLDEAKAAFVGNQDFGQIAHVRPDGSILVVSTRAYVSDRGFETAWTDEETPIEEWKR